MQAAVLKGARLGAGTMARQRVSPVGVLSFLEDMVWRHAQHVHNAHQQVMLRSSRKQGQTQEQLSSHAAQGPHVYCHVIAMPQQHLLGNTRARITRQQPDVPSIASLCQCHTLPAQQMYHFQHSSSGCMHVVVYAASGLC